MDSGTVVTISAGIMRAVRQGQPPVRAAGSARGHRLDGGRIPISEGGFLPICLWNPSQYQRRYGVHSGVFRAKQDFSTLRKRTNDNEPFKIAEHSAKIEKQYGHIRNGKRRVDPDA